MGISTVFKSMKPTPAAKILEVNYTGYFGSTTQVTLAFPGKEEEEVTVAWSTNPKSPSKNFLVTAAAGNITLSFTTNQEDLKDRYPWIPKWILERDHIRAWQERPKQAYPA